MTDIALIEEKAWIEARRRAEIVRPLAEMPRCPRRMVSAAAQALGLSERQVYGLIKRCRLSDGTVSALAPKSSSGGRGKSRLSYAREQVLRQIIDQVYLTRQRVTPEVLIREVRHHCARNGMPAPAASTIRRRLKHLSPDDRRKRGESAQVKPAAGMTPIPKFPLDLLQLDHTKVDVIIVDPVDRKPIGRPWLSVAIDVHSRCIAGMHLSLESPSATSVGLCLMHVATEKTSWLEGRGIDAEWPIAGKPRAIAVDNGAEFHSAAFERGCAQHGIAIHWRPPGQPHFGGIVERVIGTLMQQVHELPGTTFSNPATRRGYDSDGTACLTLQELEHWLTIAIVRIYHQRSHAGLGGETPIARFRQGMLAMETERRSLPVVQNAQAFLIDFLPMYRRTLQRAGITIDYITYYSNGLKPWIARRSELGPLLVRRDPRDLSRVYVLNDETEGYLEVPYRDLARPAVTLWEHRLAVRRLREQNRHAIDEMALFRAIEELRAIERRARASTKSARRNHARRQTAEPVPARKAPEAPVTGPVANSPFSEIEEW